MGKGPAPGLGVGPFLLFTSTMNLKGKQYDIQSIVLIHGHPHAGGEELCGHTLPCSVFGGTPLARGRGAFRPAVLFTLRVAAR